MLERIAEIRKMASVQRILRVGGAVAIAAAGFLGSGDMSGGQRRAVGPSSASASTEISPQIGEWKSGELTILPEILPPHITYHDQAVSLYLEGTARIVRPLRPGDIWLAQTQKLRVMGVDFDINPEANPGRAIVFAIGAATHLDLDFRTVNGVFAWTGLESSRRTGSNFLEDIQTAGRVQVSRAQIPGNCTPDGCTDVTLIMALGHRDPDGVVRFDSLPDEKHFK